MLYRSIGELLGPVLAMQSTTCALMKIQDHVDLSMQWKDKLFCMCQRAVVRVQVSGDAVTLCVSNLAWDSVSWDRSHVCASLYAFSLIGFWISTPTNIGYQVYGANHVPSLKQAIGLVLPSLKQAIGLVLPSLKQAIGLVVPSMVSKMLLSKLGVLDRWQGSIKHEYDTESTLNLCRAVFVAMFRCAIVPCKLPHIFFWYCRIMIRG